MRVTASNLHFQNTLDRKFGKRREMLTALLVLRDYLAIPFFEGHLKL